MNPAPGASGHGEDNAVWASRIAEHLPAAGVRRLVRAAAEGPGAVRALRGSAAAAVLRSACEEVLTKLRHGDPAYLAGLLAGAAEAVTRARRHQHLDVVWPGPETASGPGRLTAATVAELIGQALKEILIVSYATQTEPAIAAALAAAAERGVEVTILAERHEDNPNYTGAAVPFPDLRAIRLRWPAGRRPVAGSAMHAKIVVVDDRIALVGSANVTSRAMESNLECGILIRGGPEPRAIRDHLTELRSRGILVRASR